MMTCPYFKRRIKTTSLDYLMRLINFKKCGPAEYDFENQKYLEYEYVYHSDSDSNSDSDSDNTDKNLDVSLYFDKNEIKQNIKYNNYLQTLGI